MSAVAAIDARFVEAVRHDMVAFAQLQLRDACLAEEAVQEALAAALAGAAGFAGQAALKTWVFGILRHKIVDIIRQQSRTTPVSAFCTEDQGLDEAFDGLFRENAHWHPASRPKDWGDPEEALREKSFSAVIEVCLGHLPENTARVFMMREFLELETEEICRALAISSNNCHVILHRARAGLRGCLEKGWFEPGEARC